MYSTRSAQSAPSAVFLLVLSVIVVAAGAVIVHEAGRITSLATQADRAAATFGLMLVSLAGVMLSVVLPDRIGKALLLVGALGFFGCLTYALLNGVRF